MTVVASGNDDVTVVIANHDYGETLEEAVDSALRQEGGPPRVIVVDDGSTDAHTLEVVDRLEARSDPRLRIVRQANTGAAGARNAGMRLADTTYLLALDADDRLPADALATMRAPLDADPALGFAYGRMRFFGDWEGELVMPDYDPYALLYRHTIGMTALMRREVFAATGGFDPEFRGYEDWEHWLHALSAGWRGRRVDAVTLEYRRHGATVNTAARKAYRHWYRRLREKHAAVYARRRELAKESDLGPVGRLAHRLYWGPRPIPAALEARIYAFVFRARR
jgi:GT2 family glycosyltransferase